MKFRYLAIIMLIVDWYIINLNNDLALIVFAMIVNVMLYHFNEFYEHIMFIRKFNQYILENKLQFELEKNELE